MSRSYRQVYHANVLSGWANDPNGTIFYKGKAHLFYQHYPHKPEWGTMHWGHFATEDFVRWENLPVALVPDRDYEVICGCCSGSAIEKDGKLYLMYTAAQPDLQRQCIAISEDGVHFEKDPGNPILTAEMLSPEIFRADFRDPRLFWKDGSYWMIAGVRWIDPDKSKNHKPSEDAPAVRDGTNVSAGGSAVSFLSGSPSAFNPSLGNVSNIDPERDGYGNLVLLKSPDLYHWTYIGHLIYPQEGFDPEFYKLNGVFECPDYFVADDGTEVLLSSPQNLPHKGRHYQNVHTGLYMFGKLNFETGRFHVDEMHELDLGFDFYAAQSLRMPDGRVIMIAWKEMWDRSFPTQAEGWAGTYTLPRELTVENGKLIQRPVRELERYRKNPVSCALLETDDTAVESAAEKETGTSGEASAKESKAAAKNDETSTKSEKAAAKVGEVTVKGGTASIAGVSGNVMELSVTLEPGTANRAGVKVFVGGGNETAVYYDKAEGLVVFDRSKSGVPIRGRDKEVNRRVCEVGQKERVSLRLFLDVSSLEVFIEGGQYVMTGNVFPDPERDTGVVFYSEGGSCAFRDIEKYDIVV